jgi:hypothetical protein
MLGKQSSSTIEWIKWVAIVFMVVDHVGLILYDNNTVLRSIGRIAFPLFGYLLVHNYIYFTKDKLKYIKRLSIFGIISQPIYMYTIGNYLNIFILLALTLFIIYLIEKIPNEKIERTERSIKFMQGAIVLYGAFASLFTGYNIVGYIFILTLYLGFKNKKYNKVPLVSMSTMNYGNIMYTIGVFTSIGVLYLVKKIPYEAVRTNKWFFYIFYPTHLMVLFVLKRLF